MHLYIFIHIEPCEKLSSSQQKSRNITLTLGGLPDTGFTKGPWTREQLDAVEAAVKQWYLAEQSAVFRSRRDTIFQSLCSNDLSACVAYTTGDEGEPGDLMNEVDRLFEILVPVCEANGMTVNVYNSI